MLYPEEIEFLTSSTFLVCVGLVALLWLILRTIAKAWLIHEYRKDPEALIARIERNRQRMRDHDDWLSKEDLRPIGAPIGHGLDDNGEAGWYPVDD